MVGAVTKTASQMFVMELCFRLHYILFFGTDRHKHATDKERWWTSRGRSFHFRTFSPLILPEAKSYVLGDVDAGWSEVEMVSKIQSLLIDILIHIAGSGLVTTGAKAG